MVPTVTPETLPADSAEAKRYNRIRRWLSVADFALSFGLLVVLLATGLSGMLRDLALDGARQHYTPAVFLYVLMLAALAKLVGLPLEFYGYRLEHQFQVSNQKLKSWIGDECKGFAVTLLLGAIVVELIYSAIRFSPERWWLIAWGAFVLLFILFAQIAPVVLFPIFYKFIPLQDEQLKERLVRMSERAGTRVRGVYEWKLSEKSKKANAALTGLGNTRRIILSDTLLQNYSADEIEAVLAHELGHHVHKHIFKSIALQVAITFIGFYSANAVLRYAVDSRHMFQHISDFANLPLLALVSTALSLLLMPALNAYSRHNERQADAYCWKSIPSVAPFVSSMNKLCEQNLGERQPVQWVEWAFHSHPAVAKRIAAALAFGPKQA